jgi:protein-S-isoprenylcysteine O-methyltransferase Ste14
VSWSLTAKRLRLPLGFLLSFVYLAFAHPTPGALGLGGTIALLGVLLRGWASGHIEKNDRLATSGPYAHTRNPLYFGSFLIAAGFAIAAHWSLLLLVIAFFVGVYAPTIERERSNIRSRFPGVYEEYEQNVPAFLPRLTPWSTSRDGGENRFDLRLYMKHGEWKALLSYILAMIWLAYRASPSFPP